MRYPGFFGTTYDWVPDVQHGGMAATALQRMLLQEVGDQLILLPAWPENWNAGFKLHARKKTIIEGRVENGRLTALRVTPECRLKDVLVGLDLLAFGGEGIDVADAARGHGLRVPDRAGLVDDDGRPVGDPGVGQEVPEALRHGAAGLEIGQQRERDAAEVLRPVGVRIGSPGPRPGRRGRGAV